MKDFKGLDHNSVEYRNLYDEVLAHPFVKKFENSQNANGFWPPFHGYTEGVILYLLSCGLDKRAPVLDKVLHCLVRLLEGVEATGQHEKHDNPLWYPVVFEPLIFSAMLSLLDGTNENIVLHRQRWARFAESVFSKGVYDAEADSEAQRVHFEFKTKRTIPPFGYYNLLLLAPKYGDNYISDKTDQGLVDYLMNEAAGIYYVYNNKLGEPVPISAQNKDSRDFCNWIRALSLVSQFKGWEKYEQKYVDWIMTQRNEHGLWEFPKKFDFALSNSWRGKNKMIDSTIFVLRLLMKKKAF